MPRTFISDPFCVFTEQYLTDSPEPAFRIANGLSSAHAVDRIDGLSIFFTGVIYNLAQCADSIGMNADDPRRIIAGLYRSKGELLPTLLEGTYAIVIVAPDRVVAFRDRFGVENLYCSIDRESGSFILASSIAEIQKRVPLRVNRAVLPKFFLFQQLNGNDTFFEGISSVAPRELLVYAFSSQTWRSTRYDDLPYRPLNPDAGDDPTIIAATEDKLRRAIRRLHETFSTFSWINSYSGGTDSSLQAVLLKECGHRTAYTTCHAHSHGDDVAYYARSVADVLEIDHHLVRVQPRDLLRCIERAIVAAEMPYVFEGECLLEGMHQAIAEKGPSGPDGTLVVNGHGSDALFAHGRQLVELAQLSRTGVPFLLTIVNALLIPGLTPSAYQRYRAIGEALRTGRFDEQSLQVLLCTPKSVDLVRRAFHLEGSPGIFRYELDEMERYGVSPLEQMYRLWIFEHETTRANNVNYQIAKAKRILLVFPFRDLELVDYLVSIPTERKLQRFTSKYYVKQLLARYLPASLVHRRKILQHREDGFLAILKSDPGFERLIDEIRAARYPYFDFDIDEVFSGTEHESIGLFLINFHIWHRHFIGDPAVDTTVSVKARIVRDRVRPSIAIGTPSEQEGAAAGSA